MKKLLITALLAAAFAAQAAPQASTATTPATIPTAAAEVASQSEADTANLVAKAETRTLAYYDAEGNEAPQASAGGFYRMLLGRTADGKAVVQDFYQDSKTKQIDPVVIPDDKDLKNFDASSAADGRMVWYTPEGEVKAFQDIKNHKSVASGRYENGKLALKTEDIGNTLRIQLYHDNGKLAFDGSGSYDDSQKVKFKIISRTGKVLADSEKKIKATGKNAEEAANILLRVQKLND